MFDVLCHLYHKYQLSTPLSIYTFMFMQCVVRAWVVHATYKTFPGNLLLLVKRLFVSVMNNIFFFSGNDENEMSYVLSFHTSIWFR